MGTFKKTFYVCSLVLAAVFVSVISAGWLGEPKLPKLETGEQAVIRLISFDDTNHRTLLLDLQSMSSKTITFSMAVIRNSELKTITAVCPIQTELPEHEKITIAVGPTNILAPGNYTVTLETVKGNAFVSSFAVQ
jgi:energy-converting hydrogenase Eha subunit A